MPGPIAAVVAPVHPPLRAQPAQQGRRELERLVAEDVVGQELEALALLGPGDRHDRVAGVLVGLVVARDRLAADELRGQGGAVAALVDQDAERPPGPGPRVAVLDHAGVQVLEQLGRQGDPILAELAGVRTQVEPVDVGIVVEEGVLVGRVDQVVLGSTRGDLLQLGRLVTVDRLVGVLDGPVVIGADGGRVVVALLLSLGCDVDRAVVHDAADQPLGAGDGRVVELLLGEHRAGLEVVPQAQRVADLVHHDVLDRLADELLGQLGLGLGLLRGLVLVFLFVLIGLGRLGLGYVGQGDGGQAEIVLEARLELAEAPSSAREVLGQLPLEEVLIGRDDLGDHLAGGPVESSEAEQSLGRPAGQSPSSRRGSG